MNNEWVNKAGMSKAHNYHELQPGTATVVVAGVIDVVGEEPCERATNQPTTSLRKGVRWKKVDCMLNIGTHLSTRLLIWWLVWL